MENSIVSILLLIITAIYQSYYDIDLFCKCLSTILFFSDSHCVAWFADLFGTQDMASGFDWKRSLHPVSWGSRDPKDHRLVALCSAGELEQSWTATSRYKRPVGKSCGKRPGAEVLFRFTGPDSENKTPCRVFIHLLDREAIRCSANTLVQRKRNPSACIRLYSLVAAWSHLLSLVALFFLPSSFFPKPVLISVRNRNQLAIRCDAHDTLSKAWASPFQ